MVSARDLCVPRCVPFRIVAAFASCLSIHQQEEAAESAPFPSLKVKGRSHTSECSTLPAESFSIPVRRGGIPPQDAELDPQTEAILRELKLQVASGSPPGAMYSKNGVWLDHAGMPVGDEVLSRRVMVV